MGRKKVLMWPRLWALNFICEQGVLTLAMLMVDHTSSSQLCSWLLTVAAEVEAVNHKLLHISILVDYKSLSTGFIQR